MSERSEPIIDTAPTALVIAHEPHGRGGQVAVRLEQRGFVVTTHVVTPDVDRPNAAAPFPEFGAYDVVAMMGSTRSLTRKHEIDTWIYDELDRIRRAHEAGQALLGVCFGGQLIAEALGGAVESAGKEQEIGWFEIDPVNSPGHEQHPVERGPWLQWHHDRFTPPPGSTVLATTPRSTQLFTIGSAVGTQFHPEVDHHHLARFLSGASDEYLAANGIDPEVMLAPFAREQDAIVARCHALVDWFLDRADVDRCVEGAA
jgi:GMP synthase-like glutamine amidotransferase